MGERKATKQGKEENMKLLKTDSSIAVPASQLQSQDT